MADFSDKVKVKNCKVIQETQLAILVNIDGNQDEWVPKSQIDDDSEVWKSDQEGTLVVSAWFANKKGL